MFTLITAGCPKGWAFVRDYMGNLVYYGSIDDCHHFMNTITEELLKGWENLVNEEN